jgi:hypothetical protein
VQYGARAFSMPTPGGGLPPTYGGPGLMFNNGGGPGNHASATAAATAALQVTLVWFRHRMQACMATCSGHGQKTLWTKHTILQLCELVIVTRCRHP